jgi:predicted amidohydrolase
MRIAIAQTNPAKGDIARNIENHLKFIEKAIEDKADLVVFPELSITGYEPTLAAELATIATDSRFAVFQELSNKNNLTICIGAPTRNEEKLHISMFIFQPNVEPLTYSKQYLHHSEISVFAPSNTGPVFFKPDGKGIVTPAICFELSVEAHAANVVKGNATFYIASVLNPVSGVDNDLRRLSAIAVKYGINTFMANYTGFSGGYHCAGKSSVWDTKGNLLAQLPAEKEGILVFDSVQNRVKELIFNVSSS